MSKMCRRKKSGTVETKAACICFVKTWTGILLPVLDFGLCGMAGNKLDGWRCCGHGGEGEWGPLCCRLQWSWPDPRHVKELS